MVLAPDKSKTVDLELYANKSNVYIFTVVLKCQGKENVKHHCFSYIIV